MTHKNNNHDAFILIISDLRLINQNNNHHALIQSITPRTFIYNNQCYVLNPHHGRKMASKCRKNPNKKRLRNHVEKIIRIANDNEMLVVATSDCHCLTKKDKIFRKIIINQKNPGGGLHPLNKKDIVDITMDINYETIP